MSPNESERQNPEARLASLLEGAPSYPERIVCLTEETTEILYRIGAGDRVIGVSGFTVRPKEARKKPRVSSFLDANFDRILELKEGSGISQSHCLSPGPVSQPRPQAMAR